MKKSTTLSVLGAILTLTAAMPASADGHTRGEMLSFTCAGCHGSNGLSTGPAIPTIAGMDSESFTEAMTGYKDGRSGTIMDRIAKGYSADDIAAMAKYFGKQKFAPAKQEADSSLAKAGQKLHEKHCEKCHEEGGSLDVDGSSRLAGQWKPYLVYSLADFNSGAREAPKKMKKALEKATAQDKDAMAALVEYYASQQ